MALSLTRSATRTTQAEHPELTCEVCLTLGVEESNLGVYASTADRIHMYTYVRERPAGIRDCSAGTTMVEGIETHIVTPVHEE